jgi:ABC-type dipeptide/oligopeptide/nickel transport system permease subunit
MSRVAGVVGVADEVRRRRAMPRSVWVGGLFLALMLLACVGSLPWTTGNGSGDSARYKAGTVRQNLLPPWWWGARDDAEAVRLNGLVDPRILEGKAAESGVPVDTLIRRADARELREHWPIRQNRIQFLLGTDSLGRSLLIRCLTGGGVSLCIGIAAAALSVLIGTLYGAIAGYAGGLVDGVMMRIVDILYGLPYVLLVVLLAVAVDAGVENWVEARVKTGGTGAIGAGTRNLIDVGVLLVAIEGRCSP